MNKIVTAWAKVQCYYLKTTETSWTQQLLSKHNIHCLNTSITPYTKEKLPETSWSQQLHNFLTQQLFPKHYIYWPNKDITSYTKDKLPEVNGFILSEQKSHFLNTDVTYWTHQSLPDLSVTISSWALESLSDHKPYNGPLFIQYHYVTILTSWTQSGHKINPEHNSRSQTQALWVIPEINSHFLNTRVTSHVTLGTLIGFKCPDTFFTHYCHKKSPKVIC